MRAAVLYAPKDLRIEMQADPQIGPKQVRARMAAGGICGSDLHYYFHGGFGTVKIKQPMILGHEVSGIVSEVGREVESVKVGDPIAIHPSRPCGHCQYCLEGAPNHCLNMRFYGSAMPFPHIQGAFQESLVLEESQCLKVGAHLSLNHAAFAEPLSVALHACRQAGDLLGKRVLVTGVGPIGALVVAAAKVAGAREIVCTDLEDHPLAGALKMGATHSINVAAQPDGLKQFEANKGYFDVAIECSGNARALSSALAVLRPRGIMIQLGLGGDMNIPVNMITAKEISLRGSFRFHEEFHWAVDYLNRGIIDVAPIFSGSIPLSQANEAFELAQDRKRAIKVQVHFS
jgi:L-idonate 5-dehydrogenase